MKTSGENGRKAKNYSRGARMAKGAGETQKTTTGGGGVTGTYISNRNKKAFRANFD